MAARVGGNNCSIEEFIFFAAPPVGRHKRDPALIEWDFRQGELRENIAKVNSMFPLLAENVSSSADERPHWYDLRRNRAYFDE